MKEEQEKEQLSHFTELNNEKYEIRVLHTELSFCNHSHGNDEDYFDSQNINDQSSDLSSGQTIISPKRTVWTESNEIRFFKCLGLYNFLFPKEFRAWKFNKKKIFIAMERIMGNMDRTQCKSKFASLKRTHENPQKKKLKFECMRDLILSNLRNFEDSDEECSEIIKLMLNQKKHVANQDLSNCLKLIQECLTLQIKSECSQLESKPIVPPLSSKEINHRTMYKSQRELRSQKSEKKFVLSLETKI